MHSSPAKVTTRMRKADLIHRIEDMQRELDALYYEQRPSRKNPEQRNLVLRHSVPEHFAKAKELAMQTGRPVRVESQSH